MKITFILVCLCITHITLGQWNSNPALNTPVCTALNKQIDPRILEDGYGGAFVVWKDYRNSLPDVFVQRINNLGVTQWALNGVGACTDAADQSTPNVCSDGQGGIIVAWSDWRSGIERDLYAQRIDPNGNVLWVANGIIVSNKPNREHNEKIVSDGFGGAIVVWEQQEANGTWNEWAQRINSSGGTLWPPGGIPITGVQSNKINGRLEADGEGGAFIVWQDYRNGVDYDIYAQHVDLNGNLVWGSNAKVICTAIGTQASPKIESDELLGGFYTSWVDARNGDNDIFAQRIDANGNLLWANNGVSICSIVGNQSALDILSDPTVDGLICAWKDSRTGNFDIYAQRVNSAGIAQWANNGISICSNPTSQLNPNIAIDNATGAIITWQDSLGGNFDIRAQRVNSLGTLLWNPMGAEVGIAVGDQTSVKNCSDGATGSIFVFMDKRSGVNDIYAHHLYGTGLPYSLAELQEDMEQKITVYPNPAYDFINFKTDGLSIDQVSVLTINGKLLFTGTLIENVLDIQGINPGLYLLSIKSGENQITQQIVIR